MSRGPRGPGSPPAKPKEKPWFGKRCKRCDAPINYAFKSVIEGWCGKCTDEVRNVFVRELRSRESPEATAQAPAELAPPSRVGPFLSGVVLTALILGAGAILAPGPFDGAIASLRRLAGGKP